MEQETLYLKLERNILVHSNKVRLGEIAEFLCAKQTIVNKVKTLPLEKPAIPQAGRYVGSVMDVIEAIQKEYPNLEISNLGEADFILTLEQKKRPPKWVVYGKTAFICILAFFGAAFSIMAFNNDVGVTRLFSQLYLKVTGKPSDGFTILEVSYAIGMGMGILLFFHHFSKKDHQSDATPLEMEMRKYEEEVDKTRIEHSS